MLGTRARFTANFFFIVKMLKCFRIKLNYFKLFKQLLISSWFANVCKCLQLFEFLTHN